MVRLIRVELSRYGSRRAIALLVLLAALLAAGVAFKTAWDSRPPSKLEIATAKAAAQNDASRTDIQAQIDSCLKSPTEYFGLGATAQECRDIQNGVNANYLPRHELDLEGTLK